MKMIKRGKTKKFKNHARFSCPFCGAVYEASYPSDKDVTWAYHEDMTPVYVEFDCNCCGTPGVNVWHDSIEFV